MPLFEYECKKCGCVFEELVGRNSDKGQVPCKSCDGTAQKRVSRFSSKVLGGKETIDVSIGQEANRRWQAYHDRQSKRRSGKELSDVSIPKGKDGKFMPVMALGQQKDREKRNEYVGALQEHRAMRKKKGIPQFSGPGEF